MPFKNPLNFYESNDAIERAVTLSNRIAITFGCLTLIYLFYILTKDWPMMYTTISAINTIVLFSIVWINRSGFNRIGRVILSLSIPLVGLIILLLPRINQPGLPYFKSTGIYTVLLATSIVPILIFTKRDRLWMWICLLFPLSAISLLDVLMFKLSDLNRLPTLSEYLANNLSLLLSYFLLMGSVLSLKNLINQYEAQNEQLFEEMITKNIELETANRELHSLNQDVETQNEEIQAQSEELIQSQESLVMANNEIERQKLELEKQNDFLEKSLDQKSLELLHSNQQLVRHNNELEQFSYTVSHNLRGPVASMLGLININRFTEKEHEKEELMNLIMKSALSLETIIQDLNKIVEIRNDKFSMYEEVFWKKEFVLIQQSLNNFYSVNDVVINHNFEVQSVVSIKAYIHSILYNLISNAIQYRNPERQTQITITTRHVNEHTILEVQDNGLGIDMSKFKDDLFKLYKRFHIHTQGKGLGLYLVRQQVEKLNGTISVESEVDRGTTFRVSLPELKLS